MSEIESTSHKAKRHSIKRRIIATFVAAIMALVAIAIVCGFQYIHWYEHTITDQMAQSAVDSCDAVFEAIALDNDGDMSDEPANYESWRVILRELCINNRMDYMYAFRYNAESNDITYIMCVASDDDADELMRNERSFGTTVAVEIPVQVHQALAGESNSNAIILDNQYGQELTWFRKVDGWNNVVAGVDYSISKQRMRVITIAASIIIPLVIVLIALLIWQLRILNTRIFTPLQIISNHMKQFSSDRATEYTSIGIKQNNEIGDIAGAFEHMASDIDAYLGDIEHMTAERVRANVQLDVARRIQLGMVPERTRIADNSFDVIALSHAARAVGGDFYDIAELGDGNVAAVIGDVSGKGIGAALFMAMAKALISDGLKAGKSPANVLNDANERLCAENPEGMFVTVFACVLTPATGEVRYANAGHTLPLLVDADARVLDIAPGVLLGLFEDVDLEDGSFVLEEGQQLLLYTDGVTEAVNAEREFFGEEKLMGCISAETPFTAPAALADSVMQTANAFAGDAEQFDDITIVALQRNVAGMRQVTCDMASFADVRTALLATNADEAFKRRACLVCEEAFANIVMHSKANVVRFKVTYTDECLNVTLEDDGIPFDPTLAQSANKGFEELDNGGMGINLMKQLASSMAYRHEGNMNILELAFRANTD